MPLGFLVIYVVSLMTKAPSAEMQAFIDEIRKPRGPDGARRKVLTEFDIDRDRSGALRGPASLSRPAASLLLRTLTRDPEWPANALCLGTLAGCQLIRDTRAVTP